MGLFTRTFTEEIEFDGDHVVCEMKRLRNEHLLKLAPYFVELEGVTKLSFADKLGMVKAGSEVLPELVVSLKGLKDADGKELGIQDILGEMYFNPLIDHLVGQLFKRSTIKTPESEVDPKKSAPPLPGELAESPSGAGTSPPLIPAV